MFFTGSLQSLLLALSHGLRACSSTSGGGEYVSKLARTKVYSSRHSCDNIIPQCKLPLRYYISPRPVRVGSCDWHAHLAFNVVVGIVNLPFTSVSSGTYNIAGTYCYPTSAFDRLGDGISYHPNAITTVQCLAQAAIIHELAKTSRAGIAPFPRKFRELIFVGTSWGSVVGNFINVEYPEDFNSTILNGFSKFWANTVPGFTVTADLLPAVLTDSSNYGFLNDDIGYFIANNLDGVKYLLFYCPGQYYDPTFIAPDYAGRGIITVGEAIAGALGISVAAEYLGSVVVLNGNKDVVFCGTFDLPIDGPGNCNGTGILAQTKELYPKAKYSWFSLDSSGNCWQHQYTAQTGFKYAHDWLAQQGF